MPGGVLQRNNIHIATCESGRVGETLKALRQSPKTTAAKAKFILATDGETLEAEDLASGETVASDYPDFARALRLLPAVGRHLHHQGDQGQPNRRAGHRAAQQALRRAAEENPEWATEARRHDMNHFMARLIFCFFAEDTDIFNGAASSPETVEQMSERDSSNTHEVMAPSSGP